MSSITTTSLWTIHNHRNIYLNYISTTFTDTTAFFQLGRSIVNRVRSESVNYGFTLIKEISKPSIVYPQYTLLCKGEEGISLMEDIFYMNRSMPFLGENIVPNLCVYLDLCRCIYLQREIESIENRYTSRAEQRAIKNSYISRRLRTIERFDVETVKRENGAIERDRAGWEIRCGEFTAGEWRQNAKRDVRK